MSSSGFGSSGSFYGGPSQFSSLRQAPSYSWQQPNLISQMSYSQPTQTRYGSPYQYQARSSPWAHLSGYSMPSYQYQAPRQTQPVYGSQSMYQPAPVSQPTPYQFQRSQMPTYNQWLGSDYGSASTVGGGEKAATFDVGTRLWDGQQQMRWPNQLQWRNAQQLSGGTYDGYVVPHTWTYENGSLFKPLNNAQTEEYAEYADLNPMMGLIEATSDNEDGGVPRHWGLYVNGITLDEYLAQQNAQRDLYSGT